MKCSETYLVYNLNDVAQQTAPNAPQDPNKPRVTENLFVERPDQFRNEMFDMDGGQSRQRGSNWSSALDFHFDDEDGLFTIDPSTELTDRQRECTQNNGGRNGKLVGVGPSCADGDRGAGDYHDCFFNEMTRCWGNYQSCANDINGSNLVAGKYGNTPALPVWRNVSLTDCQAALKDCAKSAKKQCACEDCMYDSCMYNCGDANPSTNTTSPGDTTTDSNADTNAPSQSTSVVPGISTVGFTTSSYFIPIPRIYGRYVVSGNIVWMGNVVANEVEETEVDSSGSSLRYITTKSTQYHADFAVGLGQGPMTGTLRVWLGDTLLFSKLLLTDDSGNVVPVDGAVLDEIENTILFSNNTTDKKFYDTSKMRVTFFDGGEDQVPPVAMGSGAPGYRGLAFLLFENFNISYVGGRLPEIKVEVVSAQESVTPKLATPTDGALVADRWFVDKLSSTIYAMDTTDRIRRYSFDDLSFIDDIDPYGELGLTNGINPTATTVLPDGYLLLQEAASGTTTAALAVVDPDSKQTLARGGIATTLSVPLIYAYRYGNAVPNAAFSFGYAGYNEITNLAGASTTVIADASYGILMDANGYGLPVSYDAATRSLEITSLNMKPFVEDGTTPKVFGTAQFRELGTVANPAWPDGKPVVRDYIFTFSLNDGSAQPELMIKRTKVMDSGATFGYHTYYVMLENDAVTQATIPAVTWGGVSTGLTGAFIIQDVVRDNAVLFMKSADGNDVILAVSLKDMTAVWATAYRGIPTHMCSMDTTPSSVFAFIDVNNNVVTVDLATGDLTVAAPVDEACDGRQYYDPLRATLTYSHNGGLRRRYLSRAIGAPVSLGELFSRLASAAGIDTIDTQAIDDLTVDGYIVTNGARPRDAMLQLMKVFNVVGYEEGTTLVFKPKDETTTPVTLNADHFDQSGYALRLNDSFRQPASLKFSYADIDNFCAAASQSVRQAVRRLSLGVEDIVNETYEAPVVFATKTTARAAAERMFATSLVSTDTAEIVVGLNDLSLSIDDVVTVEWSPGLFQTHRVASVDLSPGSYQARVTLAADIGYLSDYIPVVEGTSGDTSAQTTFTRYVNMRPRVFFLPALTAADQEAAGTDSAVFYVGAHKNSSRAFAPARIDYKLLASDNYFSTGPTATAELSTGACQSVAYPLPYKSPGVPDYDSQVVVQFDKPPPLVSGEVPIESVISDGYNNLLVVGREVMQFAAVSVDPDGRTVTFSKLIRGKFGTEIHMDFHGHLGGTTEEVILVVPGSLAAVKVPLAQAVTRSPVAVKMASWTAVDQLRRTVVSAWEEVSYRPPAPAQMGRYDATNGDILLTWERRSIYGGNMKDGTDTVPLSPDIETYYDYAATQPVGRVYDYDAGYVVYVGRYNPGNLIDVDSAILGAFQQGYGGAGFSARATVKANQLYIKKSLLTNYGIDPTQDFYVAVVKLGGPGLTTPGFPLLTKFKAGVVYPPIPPSYNVGAQKIGTYAVLSPGRQTVQKLSRYLVLRRVD